MKLSKKIITLGLSSLMAFSVGLSLVLNKTSQKAVEVSATEGYTTYHNEDLGFATRDGGDARVVKGDADGGMQTKGAVLSDKCELLLNYTTKDQGQSAWIGVGGYAIYHGDSTTLRFIYLTHNNNGAYTRNSDKTGITLKTSDGSTDLASVITGNKYFGAYVNATYRFDFTNPSAVKLEFFVEYNGEYYYPFDGGSKVGGGTGVYTFAHTAVGFAAEDQRRAMAGFNSTTDGVNIFKFNTYRKDLSTIITGANAVFSYDFIGQITVSLPLSEQISSFSGYLNNNLSSWLDENGDPINFADNLLINGKTFRYWISYSAENLIIDKDNAHGILDFPIRYEAQYSPIAINVSGSRIKFFINTAFIPSDSIVITFKAGGFKSYYNTKVFVLAEDLTFYSTLNTSDYSAPGSNIKFTTAPVETVKNYGIVDSSYTIHTGAAGESTFRRYVLETNIPKDSTHMNQQYPHDHYRYMFENVLFNGKTLTYYNVWGRGNDKDYTDRSTPVLNPDYELDHPSSGINYNMVTYLQVAAGGGADSHYTLVVEISDQMMSDFGYSEYNFSLRDGSVWASLDEGSNPINVRLNATPEDKYAVINFIDDNMHMDQFVGNNNDTNACRSEGAGAQGYYLSAKSALHDLTSEQRLAFRNGNDPEIADARARYEAWATANNDGAPFDGNATIVTPLSSAGVLSEEVIGVNNNNSLLLVILISLLTISASGLYFMIRRKRGQ